MRAPLTAVGTATFPASRRTAAAGEAAPSSSNAASSVVRMAERREAPTGIWNSTSTQEPGDADHHGDDGAREPHHGSPEPAWSFGRGSTGTFGCGQVQSGGQAQG